MKATKKKFFPKLTIICLNIGEYITFICMKLLFGVRVICPKSNIDET